jgi:hypothetical protein
MTKQVVYYAFIQQETKAVYEKAITQLLLQGFTIQAVVLDGKAGIKEVFESYGIPIQYCQFHQKATIDTYLTKRPILEASKDLRNITKTLTSTTQILFTQELEEWYNTYESFLREKTHTTFYKEGTEYKRWYYTHKRIRAAYRSLIHHLPYLFTYLHYPYTTVPNTTNCVDGYISWLKQNTVKIHRGITRERRNKILQFLFIKNNTKV